MHFYIFSKFEVILCKGSRIVLGTGVEGAERIEVSRSEPWNEWGSRERKEGECLNLQMVFELRMHPNREYQWTGTAIEYIFPLRDDSSTRWTHSFINILVCT